jgi:cytochrome c-type biogenesis protein
MRQFQRASISIFIVLVVLSGVIVASSSENVEVVVYGEGCQSCFNSYVRRLEWALNEHGLPAPIVKFHDEDPVVQDELNDIFDTLKVPEEYRQEVVVVVNSKHIFIDYVPEDQIVNFIVEMDGSDILMVYSNEIDRYHKVLTYTGVWYECDWNSNIMDCERTETASSLPTLLFLVFSSGLLDGVNPCAFTVLLFFIALIQSFASIEEGESQRLTLKIGGVYILSVFVSYLLIGVAILRAVTLIPVSNYLNLLSILILLVFGLLNVKDYFLPDVGPSIRMSPDQWSLVRSYMRKVSIPATITTGLLVSVFEFPCTGGVYLSIIGLLASRTSYIRGLLLLLLYNMAFIVPLVVVFYIAYSVKSERFSMGIWKRNERTLRLFSGLFFIILAIIMLVAF